MAAGSGEKAPSATARAVLELPCWGPDFSELAAAAAGMSSNLMGLPDLVASIGWGRYGHRAGE